MPQIKLAVSEEGERLLDKLRKMIGVDSREDVVREALSFYTWAAEKMEEGFGIRALKEIPDKPGELESIKPALPGLKKIKPKAA